MTIQVVCVINLTSTKTREDKIAEQSLEARKAAYAEVEKACAWYVVCDIKSVKSLDAASIVEQTKKTDGMISPRICSNMVYIHLLSRPVVSLGL